MVDNEYRGRNARVRLEGDELLFSKGGRMARAVAGPTDWRIPVACIREVVFKDAKFATGMLHLVIADAETPKATTWGLADKPWTVEFQAGKQSRAMRELRDVLTQRIADNQRAGIDPTTARRPYADTTGADELHEIMQKALSDTLVEAPAEGMPVHKVIALAKQSPAYASFHSDLDSLALVVRPGESLLLVAQGLRGVAPVLLALTDQRVLLHADSATAKVRESLELPVRASWNSTPVSSALTFQSGVHEIRVGAISDAVAEAFLSRLQ